MAFHFMLKTSMVNAVVRLKKLDVCFSFKVDFFMMWQAFRWMRAQKVTFYSKYNLKLSPMNLLVYAFSIFTSSRIELHGLFD